LTFKERILLWITTKIKEGENILVVLKRFKSLHKIFSYSSGVIPCENDYCKAYERQYPVKISLNVLENDEMFIIILKKETIYVLAKRVMNEQQQETLRKTFSELLDSDYEMIDNK